MFRVLLITLVPILVVQGSSEGMAMGRTNGMKRPKTVRDLRTQGQESAGEWNAKANHWPVIKEVLRHPDTYPVTPTPIDLDNGCVKAGEVIEAWARPQEEYFRAEYLYPPPEDFPKEGDTVDYFDSLATRSKVTNVHGTMVRSEYTAKPNSPVLRTGSVIWSYPWIEKIPNKSWSYGWFGIGKEFSVKMVVMVVFKSRDGERERRLGRELDVYGRSVFNVRPDNAEAHEMEDAAKIEEKRQKKLAGPPETIAELLNKKDRPEWRGKFSKMHEATSFEVVSMIMRNPNLMELCTPIAFESQILTERRVIGKGGPGEEEIQVVVNQEVKAGEIVSMWSGADPILGGGAENPVLKALEESIFDIRAFLATRNSGNFQAQDGKLPKMFDTIRYWPDPTKYRSIVDGSTKYVQNHDFEPLRGIVVGSYRYMRKYKDPSGSRFLPEMKVHVYFLGLDGAQRKRALTKRRESDPTKSGLYVFEHSEGMADDKLGKKLKAKLATFMGIEAPKEGWGESDVVSRRDSIADLSGESVRSLTRESLPEPEDFKVAISENTVSVSKVHYAGAVFLLFMLAFLVNVCQRKPTPEEEPLYEPFF